MDNETKMVIFFAMRDGIEEVGILDGNYTIAVKALAMLVTSMAQEYRRSLHRVLRELRACCKDEIGVKSLAAYIIIAANEYGIRRIEVNGEYDDILPATALIIKRASQHFHARMHILRREVSKCALKYALYGRLIAR